MNRILFNPLLNSFFALGNAACSVHVIPSVELITLSVPLLNNTVLFNISKEHGTSVSTLVAAGDPVE